MRGPRLVVAVVLVGFAAWLLLEDAQDRADTDRIALEARAFVPFGGGPGGWSGRVEIRNVGSEPVSVLGIDLPRPAVLLGLHGVPVRLAGRSAGTVSVRLRLDCAARQSAGRGATPAIEVRARTVHGTEATRRVQFPDMRALVGQLAADQCGSSSGVADGLGVTYGGSQLRAGAIETVLLVRNVGSGPVTVLAVTGSTGWPGFVRTEPSTLPANVPAGQAIELRLQWDVSACPRIRAGDVISSLRMIAITPDDRASIEGVFDLGPRFARDFFRYYRVGCPGAA